MPMFNSDILKSINPELLLQTSFKAKTHSDLIEITYTIDYLKKNMPIDKMSLFKEKVIAHLKEKEIENDELYNHLLSCSFYEKLSKEVLSDLNLKIETAEELNKDQKKIIEDLKGNSFIWILKYLWRQ
ncbi:hypothetical protein [Tenacibaculum finnmarkense]|uniref:Uncharacterized protein n=1 Tax=Tenacibaculum finnmarkense genomovar finnmarkense TaxID=1458503 RepID=A0AAP1WHB9_9FLAO|nr:hypothetical protein [Tenacibaculum finnmarkense]MBE7653996.1 hypothetical protein [Tenacibaculum finnmarkense genomovar finnmarkense]MBE7696294.1 hypothetical protein [Tenacibaculum finnmarkense genomovar finnmarkense]MCD8428534.1 hypothetical protein [Tenacibaculum finnmarkense genomovar finnmarkense]MCG8732320.1 hypothetical protein [Tenacibaculum finnmarkense]MCG8753057.1 hypothetical protein [Tenacibaculum finnmarkense]